MSEGKVLRCDVTGNPSTTGETPIEGTCGECAACLAAVVLGRLDYDARAGRQHVFRLLRGLDELLADGTITQERYRAITGFSVSDQYEYYEGLEERMKEEHDPRN